MPIIEEADLSNLNHQINSQKKEIVQLKDDVELVSEEKDELKSHRLILVIISGVLLLLLLIGFISYFAYPKTFLNISKLEQNGIRVMSAEEYQHLEEILNSQNNTEEVEEESLSEQEEEENYSNQETINETVIYSIQVGAFEENNIQLYSDNLIQFKEVYNDDFYKYSVGAFSTLEEAQLFRKELVRLVLMMLLLLLTKTDKG